MPDAYLVALVLATALFIYVIVQKVRKGQAISTSLLYVPLLLGVAFLFYKIWADGQKIAKLQTEVEKAKEREKDIKMRAEQAGIEAEQEALQDKINSAEHRVGILEDRLNVEKERHAKAVDRVHAVESWGDFFAIVGGRDEGPPHPGQDH